MKYKVSNCPSFVLMRTATSGTYFDMCGNAKSHIKCADCTDCVIKQAIEKLKNPNNRTYGGRPLVFTAELLQLFDIEEARE